MLEINLGETQVVSSLCRLCGNANQNGNYIFSEEEGSSNLCNLINKYLPLRVENDGKYPNKICPGCEIQLEATKLFFDMVIVGQNQLKLVYDKVDKLPLASTEVPTDVGTFEIQSVETGEKYFIQIMDEATNEIPLYLADHQIVKDMNVLNKEKKKRGRPRKELNKDKEIIEKKDSEKSEVSKDDSHLNSTGDGKRHRKIPARYSETVQGKELDDIMRKEGIDDGLGFDNDSVKIPEAEIIGRVQIENCENSEQPIIITKRIIRQGIRKNRNQKNKKFKCEQCSEEFKSHVRLKLHIESIHTSENKINECLDQTFVPMENMNVDVEGTEEIAISSKETNVAEGTSPVDPETNEINDKIEIVHLCNKCNNSFNCEKDLEEHSCEKKRSFQCSECERSFYNSKNLRIHQLKHKKGVYPCEACPRIFHHPSSLLYHRNTEHNNGKRYVCSKCDKTFKHRQLLQRHQLVHSDERPHKCDRCSAAFKTRTNLVSHKATHTGTRNYACAMCGQTFAHKTSLNLHMRWHAGEKPFTCEVCLKSFSQKGNLFEHQRIHTGEKPFCCDFCGRNFTTSSQLKLHSKRHTGERPWKCDLCPKTFLHKDVYNSHLKLHLNERPFKCELCGKGFTSMSCLRKHMKFHTGEKPHVCEICLKAFSDISNLSKHRKTHQKISNQNRNQLPLLNANLDNNYYYVYNVGMPNIDLGQPQSEVVVDLDQDSINKGESIQFPLVDHEGNPLNLNTQDGQQISVVTSIENEEERLQGLLPDGTWVSIDLQDSKVESMEKLLDHVEEESSVSHLLLDGNMTFLNENIDKNDANILVSEQPNICFVTYSSELE